MLSRHTTCPLRLPASHAPLSPFRIHASWQTSGAANMEGRHAPVACLFYKKKKASRKGPPNTGFVETPFNASFGFLSKAGIVLQLHEPVQQLMGVDVCILLVEIPFCLQQDDFELVGQGLVGA